MEHDASSLSLRSLLDLVLAGLSGGKNAIVIGCINDCLRLLLSSCIGGLTLILEQNCRPVYDPGPKLLTNRKRSCRFYRVVAAVESLAIGWLVTATKFACWLMSHPSLTV